MDEDNNDDKQQRPFLHLLENVMWVFRLSSLWMKNPS